MTPATPAKTAAATQSEVQRFPGHSPIVLPVSPVLVAATKADDLTCDGEYLGVETIGHLPLEMARLDAMGKGFRHRGSLGRKGSGDLVLAFCAFLPSDAEPPVEVTVRALAGGSRKSKGGRRREVGMDDWGWRQLEPWLKCRLQLRLARSSASSTDLRLDDLGHRPRRERSFGALPSKRPFAVASSHTSYVTPMRSRWRGKAFPERDPTPARTRGPRHYLGLPAGNRQRPDRRGRSRTCLPAVAGSGLPLAKTPPPQSGARSAWRHSLQPSVESGGLALKRYCRSIVSPTFEATVQGFATLGAFLTVASALVAFIAFLNGEELSDIADAAGLGLAMGFLPGLIAGGYIFVHLATQGWLLG